MTSFLEKIRGKEDQKAKKKTLGDIKTKKRPEGVLQLNVDIYQTPSEIVVYAPMPGVNARDLNISIESEDDVIIIEGRKDSLKEGIEKEEKWLVRECEWGSFFRQIILPQEVDASKITAKLQKGILVLKLPLIDSKEIEKKEKTKMMDIKTKKKKK